MKQFVVENTRITTVFLLSAFAVAALEPLITTLCVVEGRSA
jgi:hypothetical protein